MSKHGNYTNYANYKKEEPETTVQETTVILEEDVVDTIPEEPVETTPKVTMGVVAGCKKLNVRTEANKEADVEAELPVGTKLQIDLENSTDDWYSVCTEAGIEGYCMKAFVEIEE